MISFADKMESPASQKIIEQVVEGVFNGDPQAIELLKGFATQSAQSIPELMESLLIVLRPILLNDGMYEMLAACTRKFYDAYTKAGFSEEHALTLTMAARQGVFASFSKEIANSQCRCSKQCNGD